jgi:hypothetical protein
VIAVSDARHVELTAHTTTVAVDYGRTQTPS